jgi:hypothetical protein
MLLLPKNAILVGDAKPSTINSAIKLGLLIEGCARAGWAKKIAKDTPIITNDIIEIVKLKLI